MDDKPIVKAKDLKACDTFVMAGTIYEIHDIAVLEPGIRRITVLPSDRKANSSDDVVIKVDERTEFELISRG